jgi:hypothetical protein
MSDSSLFIDDRIGVLPDAEQSLQEAERFHMAIGKVHETLEAIARNLEEEGIDISLPALITLKLACAMTNPDRLRDFGDVQELIRYRRLTAETAQHLHPYVREKFLELVRITQPDMDQP